MLISNWNQLLLWHLHAGGEFYSVFLRWPCAVLPDPPLPPMPCAIWCYMPAHYTVRGLRTDWFSGVKFFIWIWWQLSGSVSWSTHSRLVPLVWLSSHLLCRVWFLATVIPLSLVYLIENTPDLYRELLENEKSNFHLVRSAARDLGGIPAMIHHSDMSNTIPDEKVSEWLLVLLSETGFLWAVLAVLELTV